MIALQRQVFPAPAVAQFDERPKLLRPIAWNPSADRENSQPLLFQQGSRKVLQIFKGLEAEPRLSFFVAFTVGQRVVEAEFGIRERGNKYRNIFFVGRLQDAALFAPFRQMRPNR